MVQVAHIRYDGGALLLPAQDPYEREVVFEEAEFCARRHGAVGVQLGRWAMRVSVSLDTQRACTNCLRPLGMMSFRIDQRSVCGQCARRSVGNRAEKN